MQEVPLESFDQIRTFAEITNELIMKELSQEEWRAQLEKDPKAEIIDVRTEEELEAGYIPGAKNLDIYQGAEFIEEIEKLDPEKHYYLYCRSGKRSAQACGIMEQKGFKTTYNLKGGFSEWEGETSQDL